MGRRGRGSGAEPAWHSSAVSAAPSLVAVRGRKTVTDAALPVAAAAAALGESPELVTVGVREAEQRPLLRSLFRRGSRSCLRWQPGPFPVPSALVSGLYSGTLWASRCRGGDGWRGNPPAPSIPCGGVHSGLGSGRNSSCILFFRSVFGIFFSPLPPPPAQFLGLA